MQQRHEFVARACEARRVDPVDVAQQREAVRHRQVPPQLRALAEDDADAGHVALAVRNGVAPVHLHAPAVRPQDAREQLDRWAEAQELAAQKELDDIKRQLRELRRKSRLSVTVDEQLTVQKDITVLERKKRKLRQSIFDVEDEISRKRDTLVNKLEQQMAQRTSVNDLFTIRWRVV